MCPRAVAYASLDVLKRSSDATRQLGIAEDIDHQLPAIVLASPEPPDGLNRSHARGPLGQEQRAALCHTGTLGTRCGAANKDRFRSTGQPENTLRTWEPTQDLVHRRQRGIISRSRCQGPGSHRAQLRAASLHLLPPLAEIIRRSNHCKIQARIIRIKSQRGRWERGPPNQAAST